MPEFDRRAWGYRPDVPAGIAVRFEPGVPGEMSLVLLAGAHAAPGPRGESSGALDD